MSFGGTFMLSAHSFQWQICVPKIETSRSICICCFCPCYRFSCYCCFLFVYLIVLFGLSISPVFFLLRIIEVEYRVWSWTPLPTLQKIQGKGQTIKYEIRTCATHARTHKHGRTGWSGKGIMGRDSSLYNSVNISCSLSIFTWYVIQ